VAAKECAIFRSKRAESDMRVKRPCHDAFDRNKLYADVSWLASDAIASIGLKKGKRNALQIPPIEYQYSQHVAADLPDRQEHPPPAAAEQPKGLDQRRRKCLIVA
jgi:hypothetical protein